MSTRQLRKLRKQQELLAARNEGGEVGNDEESEDEGPIQAKPRGGAFVGFAALRGMDDEDGSGGDAEEEEAVAEESKTAEATPSKPISKSKKSKKKKKKGKKPAAAPEATPPGGQAPNEPDEIDRALEELRLSQPSAPSAEAAPAEQYSPELARLLSIESHHLKVMNEMRAVFGRDVIQAAQAGDDSPGPAGGRQGRRAEQHVDLETFLRGDIDLRTGRKLQNIPDVLAKRNPFIQWKDTWPRASSGGMAMYCRNPKDDVSTYLFEHDLEYCQLEYSFFLLVQSYDPQQIIMFLKSHPYHVSSLLLVSKLAKQDQNSALAADLCERALFSFGRVALSSFKTKLAAGKARINFLYPENRQLWVAGYHYIKSLIPKGTYRTALEWAKLLISVSPEDEYGVMNFAHALAIRAHEARWFVDVCNSGLLDSSCNHPMSEYVRQTVVLAKLQLKDISGASAALLGGISKLPWLYAALFSALSLDTPRAIWGIQPRDPAEELYTQLYVHLTKDLWNNTQAVGLLKLVGEMAAHPDVDSLPPAEPVTLTIARFVYLDGTPSLMALVPPKMLHSTPNFDFDPLPPPVEQNIFTHPAQRVPWGIVEANVRVLRIGGRRRQAQANNQRQVGGQDQEDSEGEADLLEQVDAAGEGSDYDTAEGLDDGLGEAEGWRGLDDRLNEEGEDWRDALRRFAGLLFPLRLTSEPREGEPGEPEARLAMPGAYDSGNEGEDGDEDGPTPEGGNDEHAHAA